MAGEEEEEECFENDHSTTANMSHQIVGDGSSVPLVGSKRLRRTFDVFISFRGTDTRDTFTSHLSSALYKKQIDVFVDDRLETGDKISEGLVEAIRGSKVSLVVFSENYAFSSWCLDELVQILECKKSMGQLVIPIFYNVDPSHVRWQKQSFAAAFDQHEERYKGNMEKMNLWRSALKQVADLSGWDSSVEKSDSQLIDGIVRDTVKKLSCISYGQNLKSPCDISRGLVGIDSRMKKVLSLLDIGGFSGFRIVGIWGMGGIGKTTVAEAVFNQIKDEFQGFYFFSNVRATEEKGDLVKKRDEILSAILEEKLHIGTYCIQPSFVVDRLRRKRVLVVLDDVNNRRQLEIFFGGLDLFGAGSRVIITTRDRQVLSSFDIRKVYDVVKLNDDEALQLFRLNASLSDHRTEAYHKLSKRVVDYASGVPLVLKVLARSLHGKDKHEWESALNKLGKVPNLQIRDILKVSYDGLEDEEIKNVFLDIACFFTGQDIDDVARVLNGCYHAVFHGISVLKDKALINIKLNKIEMPDPLQELGWDIVIRECKSEPGRRTRLWRPEDVHHVLKRNTGTETVRGILGDLSKMKEVNISPDVFERMYYLRLLKFYGSPEVNTKVYVPHDLVSLPDELRYLCWHGFPLKCLPPAFCPENLVELDMSYSNLIQLWSGTQNLGSLKIVNLAYSKKLKELPDLSGARKLERINMKGCLQIDEFSKVPTNIQEIDLSETAIEEVPSIASLSMLSILHLGGCRSLKTLPDDIWKLKSLKHLSLGGCSKLGEIPEVLESNECLEWIDLNRTAIKELPPSIGRLVRLEILQVNYCHNLSVLPDTLGNLENLIVFLVWGTAIRELPSSVERLVRLKRLWVDDCHNLSKLPDTLGNLENLTDFSACRTAIKELPLFGKDLTELDNLRISGSHEREPLPLSIPPLSRARSLTNLKLKNLHIEQLPEDIGCLTSLRKLDLRGNDFKSLPASIKHLSELEELYISYCTSLESLPELPSGLDTINAHSCASLGTMLGDMEFLAAAFNGRYIFSNCFRLLEDVSIKILAAAKLLFQPLTQSAWSRRKVMVCLSSSNAPDWFTDWVKCPSMTVQLPTKVCKQTFAGVALCICVAFMNDCPQSYFRIICEYSFESEEGDYHKGCTCLYKWGGFKTEKSWEKSKVRRGCLGSKDHVFLCYDGSIFSDSARANPNRIYKAMTFTFRIVDKKNETLKGCRVEKCGYYMIPNSL